jgi:hypothetical protein
LALRQPFFVLYLDIENLDLETRLVENLRALAEPVEIAARLKT